MRRNCNYPTDECDSEAINAIDYPIRVITRTMPTKYKKDAKQSQVPYSYGHVLKAISGARRGRIQSVVLNGRLQQSSIRANP